MIPQPPGVPARPVREVPIPAKLGYATGSFADNLMANGVGQLINYVLNIGLGMDPRLVGLLQSLPRLYDGFTDSVMGHVSDRTRSRFGRRRPYIFLGAIFAGLFFALLWLVPREWSQGWQFGYFLGVSLLFYTAYTVFGVPWFALGFELSTRTHERTRIMALSTVFATLSGLVTVWLFRLAESAVFTDIVEGARYVGCGVGLLIVLAGVVPALVNRDALCPSRSRVPLRRRASYAIWGRLCRAGPSCCWSSPSPR